MNEHMRVYVSGYKPERERERFVINICTHTENMLVYLRSILFYLLRAR